MRKITNRGSDLVSVYVKHGETTSHHVLEVDDFLFIPDGASVDPKPHDDTEPNLEWSDA